jgi:hypothetical protein
MACHAVHSFPQQVAITIIGEPNHLAAIVYLYQTILMVVAIAGDLVTFLFLNTIAVSVVGEYCGTSTKQAPLGIIGVGGSPFWRNHLQPIAGFVVAILDCTPIWIGDLDQASRLVIRIGSREFASISHGLHSLERVA